MACFVEVGVKDWMFNNVKDICAIHQKNDLVCPHNQVFFTASAVWCGTLCCREYIVVLTEILNLQGSHWADSTIRKRRIIPPATLRSHRWSDSSHSLLAMAAALPKFMDKICQHSRLFEWCWSYSSCHGNQLFVIFRGRVHIPIRYQEAEFRMVVEVQLCHKRCNGQWCVSLVSHFFSAPVILMCNAPGTVMSLIFIFLTLGVSTLHGKTCSSV